MTRGRTDSSAGPISPASPATRRRCWSRPRASGVERLGWRDGRGELVVTLQPEAVLTGEVRDPAGAPLKDADVSLVGASGDAINSPVDAGRQGRFRLAELPEGDYTLTIRTFGSELHQERIALRPGQVLDRTIRLSGKAEEKAMRGGLRGDGHAGNCASNSSRIAQSGSSVLHRPPRISDCTPP